QTDPTTGRPVSNGARNVWVTETALTGSLFLAFTASGLSLFAIVVGIALLLAGIGFLILAASGAAQRVPFGKTATEAPGTSTAEPMETFPCGGGSAGRLLALLPRVRFCGHCGLPWPMWSL